MEVLDPAGAPVQLIELAGATPRKPYQAVLRAENGAGLSASMNAAFVVDLEICPS